MKRAAIGLIVCLLAAAPLALGFFISRLSTEELIICATTNDAFRIPKKACRLYFDKLTDASSAKQLDDSAGIAFAFANDDVQERSAVIERLITLGADPSGISKIDGLTPLNAAILLNDPQLVQLLLDHDVDRHKPDAANHLNAADYLALLQQSQPSINRDAVAAKLKNK